MTLRELLSLVSPSKLDDPAGLPLAAALHDSEGSEAPVLVRLFTAIGTWIGAAMIAVIVFALELHEIIPLALVVAAISFLGAAALARRSEHSLALTQLIWALTLGAHGLVAGAFVELEMGETTMALTGTLLTVATMFSIRVPSLQLVSAVGVVGFATWLAASLDLPMYPLWVALPVAAVATAAWIFELGWARRLGRSWSALAYGLPIGVAGPLTLIGLDERGPGLVASGWGAPIATLAMLGLIAWVLVEAGREQGEAIELRAYLLAGVAAVAVLAARHVPGLSLSLLWLLVAHLRKSAGLQSIALIQLAGFLFFFYYQLDTTLLLKSLWVVSTGVVLLLGAWLARPRARLEGEAGSSSSARRSRWLPAIVLAALTSGLIVIPTVQKERVLASGQTVLLPLAPVDPRSLMQGDYMALRYQLERELEEARGSVIGSGRLPRKGALVIALDDEGVGHFARLDEGGPLADNELRLRYRLRDDWGPSLRVGAESFLFEEGTAQRYEHARYGELVVAEDGESILVGLRDADKRVLGRRLHELAR